MKDNERILVVDDDESLRGVVSEVLMEDGFQVDAAESGERALLLNMRNPYDLVITDIRMGGMDGIELLQRIKQKSEGTQVIIMTSFASMESAIAAMRAGAYDYLIKPFEDLNLISVSANRVFEKIRLVRENRDLIKNLKNHTAELERTNAILKRFAMRDELTGLYNLKYYREAIEVEMKRAKEHARVFSVIMLEVDSLKQIVEAEGEEEGNNLLVEMARLLKSVFSGAMTLVRYSEEAFCILLPELDKEKAQKVAEKIRHGVEYQPFAARRKMASGKITVSLGVATFPKDGEFAPSLSMSVGRALQSAKLKGGNSVVVHGG